MPAAVAVGKAMFNLNPNTSESQAPQAEASASPALVSPWREIGYRPLVYLTVALIGGVVVAEEAAIPLSLSLLIALGAAVTGFWVSRKRSGHAHLWLAVAFFLAGITLHAAEFVLPANDISRFAPAAQAHIKGHIVQVRQQSPHWRRLVVEVTTVQTEQGTWPATGCVSLSQSDPQQPVAAGETVEVDVENLRLPPTAMNLGQFDLRRYLRRQGITTSARVVRLYRLPYSASLRFKLAHVIQLARQRALQNFRRAMPGAESEGYADLMAGMVYGMQASGAISEDTKELFRRSGTIHLLVVSGAQVTFIVFALILLVTARRHWALRPWHALIIGPPLVGFVLLAGLGPSVSRSLVMAVILIYALVTGRRYDLPNAIGLAALVLVIADTNVVLDIGAQLTFAATLGVAIFAPRSYRDVFGVTHRPHLVGIVGLATLGVWVMVTPILAGNFYSFGGLGSLANLIAVPISMLVVPLGMVALITGSALLPVTRLLCWLAGSLMKVMLASNAFFAQLPGAYIDNVYFSWPVAVLWYLGLGSLLLMVVHPPIRRWVVSRWQRLNQRWVLVGGVVTLAAVLAAAALTGTAAPLRVTFLAVGEGHCVIIEAPNGQAVMIDAGSSDYAGSGGQALADQVIVPFLARRGIRRLKAIIITHSHADHCNAVPGLIRRVPVDIILHPGLSADTKVYRSLTQTARDEGVPICTARAGGQLQLGTNIEAILLAPSEPLLRGTSDDINNNSVCLRLSYGQTSFVFLADQQQEGLERLIRWARQHRVPLNSSVVQLPHHGRHLGEAQAVLAAANPQVCIISGGEAVGLSAKPALLRGCETLVTDEVGMITLLSNGQQGAVRTFLPVAIEPAQLTTAPTVGASSF